MALIRFHCHIPTRSSCLLFSTLPPCIALATCLHALNNLQLHQIVNSAGLPINLQYFSCLLVMSKQMSQFAVLF